MDTHSLSHLPVSAVFLSPNFLPGYKRAIMSPNTHTELNTLYLTKARQAGSSSLKRNETIQSSATLLRWLNASEKLFEVGAAP